MAGLIASDIILKVPSLANVLLNAANPEDTPLLSMAKKGKRITQMTHTYGVEVNPSRSTAAATDGEDVSSYEGGGPRKELNIRAQEFRRSFKVGQQSQDIIEDAAITDQFGYLKVKYGVECLKDAEAAIMGDQASQADQGTATNGSKLSGFGDRLITTGAADQAIDSSVRIPSSQIYSGAIASFYEANLVTLMQARRTTTGRSSDLLFLVGIDVQAQMDNFERFDVIPASYGGAGTASVSVRNMENVGASRTMTRGIRFYDGSFGQAKVIMEDFMPNAKRAYLLDMEQVEILPHNNLATFKPLPDLGGGPRGLMYLTLAAKVGDPRGHIKIVGS
jgi:hypothetical protein